eukprot:1493689-Amphidinium_carterae.1
MRESRCTATSNMWNRIPQLPQELPDEGRKPFNPAAPVDLSSADRREGSSAMTPVRLPLDPSSSIQA